MVLSNTAQTVERSLFEALRLKLVFFGYLPDIISAPIAPIVSVDTAGPYYFYVDSNVEMVKVSNFITKATRQITIMGSTGNNGTYTIIDITTTGPLIRFQVVEPIVSLSFNGNLQITSYPNNVIGVAQYKADISQIVTDLGFAVELFGVGSNQNRYNKKVPRIVINKNNVLPGALGGPPSVVYGPDENNSANFQSLVLPPQTKDFSYSIHLVWNEAKQLRVMESILALGLPARGYIDIFEDPPNKFFVHNTGFTMFPDYELGIEDHIYVYEVPDLYDRNSGLVRPGIVPITEIKIEESTGESVVNPTPFNTNIIT